MKFSQAVRALIPCLNANLVPFLWGPPGVGKSAIVAEVAKLTGRKLYDLRVTLLDPVDLRGLPHVENGITRWAIPSFLPVKNEPAILFFDELSSAPPMMQCALYQAIYDRRLGDWVAPDQLVMIGAGNRQSDRAVAVRMSSALGSRLASHIDIEADLDDWSDWAFSTGNIMPEIVSFLRFRPELLYGFDPARTKENTFPCPRTWEFASRVLTVGIDPDVEYDVIKGIVGEGAAREFVAYLKLYRTLPNPDAILLTPDTAIVPKDPATLYAICGALARMASVGCADRLFQYAERLPAEFSALLASLALKRDQAIASSAGFTKWATKHNWIND